MIQMLAYSKAMYSENHLKESQIDSIKYYFHVDMSKASKLIEAQMEIAKENDDSLLLIDLLVLKGRYEFLDGKSDISRKLLFEALELSNELGNDSLKGYIYDNLGMVYRNNRQFDQAMKYYEKSTEIRNRFNDTMGIANLIINQSCLLRDQISMNSNDPLTDKIINLEDCNKILDSALILAKKINSEELEHEIYYLKGINLYSTKKYNASLENFLKVINYQKEIYNGNVGHELYLRVAAIYSIINKENLAYKYLDSALTVDINKLKGKALLTFLDNIKKTYINLGDYQEAVEYSTRLFDVLYTHMSKSESEQISKTQAEYEKSLELIKIEKLEAEKAGQKNTIIGTLVIVLLLLIIVYLLTMSRSKLRKKNEIIQDQRAELEDHFLLKGKLYSMIAHDLKNPLLGFNITLNKMLENREDYSEQQLEKINNLYSSSSELIQMSNNLLLWANFEDHTLKIDNQKISLKEIINKVILINNLYSKSRNIAIQIDINKKLIAIADYNILFSILHNLIHNAIKFSPVGGRMIIKGDMKQNRLNVEIIDEGIGISENDINQKNDLSKALGSKEKAETELYLSAIENQKLYTVIWVGSIILLSVFIIYLVSKLFREKLIFERKMTVNAKRKISSYKFEVEEKLDTNMDDFIYYFFKNKELRNDENFKELLGGTIDNVNKLKKIGENE